MKALVLAAGLGTRLRPLTNKRPKPLIRLGGKRIIDYTIDALKKSEEITFIVNYKEKMMKNHIEEYIKSKKYRIKIRFIKQKRVNGTASAIALSPYNEFLCINGDVFFGQSFIPKVLECYSKHKKPVISVKKVKNPKNYGVVYKKGNTFVKICEKENNPSSNLANMGVYLFTGDILEAIEKIEPSQRGEYEVTDALNQCEAKVVEYNGYWNDIGYFWDILNTNEIIMEKTEHEVLGDIRKNVKIVPPVRIGKDTVVREGSYIQGPAVIGENCTIGPNSFIRKNSVIGNNCHIGMSEVKNSIVYDNSNVPHFNYIGDSIIDENCNLGAGTTVANLRFDDKSVKMKVKNKMIDSKRRKIGCIMGRNTKTGINVTIYPGRIIGESCTVGPGRIMDKNVPDGTDIR
ncbi:MAG: bifunctional sugar-1-phosphate nucleotidylyltransferase/acetyltransferase [Euryarchaeota archaeon]|nr:bifunctional sugar-1-phosphate nucleotidylyltransferase/acetyltransferase [Euryarchaeota archaeon]